MRRWLPKVFQAGELHDIDPVIDRINLIDDAVQLHGPAQGGLCDMHDTSRRRWRRCDMGIGLRGSGEHGKG
jgi:hypothetical protein